MEINLPRKRRIVRGNRAFSPKLVTNPRKWSSQKLMAHVRKHGIVEGAKLWNVTTSELMRYMKQYGLAYRKRKLTAEELADLVQAKGWPKARAHVSCPPTVVAATKEVLAFREAVRKQNVRIAAALRRALPHLDKDVEDR
jgi:hypothetical protein